MGLSPSTHAVICCPNSLLFAGGRPSCLVAMFVFLIVVWVRAPKTCPSPGKVLFFSARNCWATGVASLDWPSRWLGLKRPKGLLSINGSKQRVELDVLYQVTR